LDRAVPPGERVRLRVINGSAMSIFDVRIPGLAMTVVQSDGNDVEPVEVDELRISTAETYDLVVEPREDRAYTIFAQSEDRTGYARGTLAPRSGMAADVPPMDPRPVRTMVDMGMAMGADHAMHGADRMQHGTRGAHRMQHSAAGAQEPPLPRSRPADLALGPTVNNIAQHPTERLDTAGEALVARRVLAYGDLRARHRGVDPRPPSRELEIHLTGNMERFIWTFDGEKFSDGEPIRLRLGERVRIILVNDSMMEHPIHLHGLWSELENGHGERRPYKHTINVKPGERLSYLVSADTPGHWAYHCHLLYHMEAGMFRTVIVS
jgi:CopA family copper-resistance protein